MSRSARDGYGTSRQLTPIPLSRSDAVPRNILHEDDPSILVAGSSLISRSSSLWKGQVVVARGASPVAQDITPTAADARETLVEWDDNDDGRITCAEARAHGIAPVRRNHPAYPYMRDGDGDGIVCEAGGSETKGGIAHQEPASAARSSRALRQYDENGNGRITCAEARRHGIAPVRRGHPAYPYMRDADGDGVVCER